MKIEQGISPAGAFIFHILIKFQFWGSSYTLIVAPIGVKFGTEEATFGPLLRKGPLLRAKFHHNWCNLRPCGAKNLKIGL